MELGTGAAIFSMDVHLQFCGSVVGVTSTFPSSRINLAECQIPTSQVPPKSPSVPDAPPPHAPLPCSDSTRGHTHSPRCQLSARRNSVPCAGVHAHPFRVVTNGQEHQASCS